MQKQDAEKGQQQDAENGTPNDRMREKARQEEGGTGVHGQPEPDSAAGQSSATDWDMNKTKPNQ